MRSEILENMGNMGVFHIFDIVHDPTEFSSYFASSSFSVSSSAAAASSRVVDDSAVFSSSSSSSSASATSGAVSSVVVSSAGKLRLAARTRIVRQVKGASGEVYLHCSCLLYVYKMIACRHVLCVKRLQYNSNSDDCWHFRWTRRFRDEPLTTPRAFDDGRHGASVFGVPSGELLSAVAVPLVSSVDLEADHHESVKGAAAAMKSNAAQVKQAEITPAEQRYGTAKEKLLPMFELILGDLKLLKGEAFDEALHHFYQKFEALHIEVIEAHGDGQAVFTDFKTGVGGHKLVRHGGGSKKRNRSKTRSKT